LTTPPPSAGVRPPLTSSRGGRALPGPLPASVSGLELRRPGGRNGSHSVAYRAAGPLPGRAGGELQRRGCDPARWGSRHPRTACLEELDRQVAVRTAVAGGSPSLSVSAVFSRWQPPARAAPGLRARPRTAVRSVGRLQGPGAGSLHRLARIGCGASCPTAPGGVGTCGRCWGGWPCDVR